MLVWGVQKIKSKPVYEQKVATHDSLVTAIVARVQNTEEKLYLTGFTMNTGV